MISHFVKFVKRKNKKNKIFNFFSPKIPVLNVKSLLIVLNIGYKAKKGHIVSR